MWRFLAAAALLLVAPVAAICEQGTGFDPNLKLIVNAVQTDPAGPAARKVLGIATIKTLCVDLEVAGVFRCDTIWSDGMSGFAMSDRSITTESQARMPASLDTIAFRLSNDVYYQNPVGLRSPPKDPAPKCSRNLIETSATPPPVYGAYGGCGSVTTQNGATNTLSFMSAYSRAAGAAPCFPRCQTADQFRYESTGKGVTVYVVDQAVYNHTDLKDAISPDRFYSELALLNVNKTCAAWHGTHVAALVAGDQYGTAKDATIVSVAVQPGCDGDGRTSDLLKGLDWVLERHERVGGPAVVSMSLIVTSGPAGDVLESKVKDLLAEGVVVVVAAGNFADDACNYMPANLPGVITVAALQLDVLRGVAYASPWASSNTGECVTLWAPGAYVQSASSDSPTATAIYSGTSQATPMVSGLVAQFLQRNPGANATAAMQHLKDTATTPLKQVPLKTTGSVAQATL